MAEPDAHFAAFSFVDRITGWNPGKGAHGVFHVPAALRDFPACLVAEAVGQLAAWVSMEHIGYRGRPVAALAGETRFLGGVAPGDTLELTVEIDDVDDAAVSYRGWADVAGRRVIELNDCLGPMLPVAEFDAPEALRERFALLCGAGANPDRFHGVAAPDVETRTHVPGQSLQAVVRVPAAAPFFADHFPRRPVFPATLLLHAQILLAERLAREAAGGPAEAEQVPVRMTRVKMRSFIVPGQEVELRVELSERHDALTRIACVAHDGGAKPIATCRVEFAVAGVVADAGAVAS
jgi:3-hydroxymyristoyl/3-hydroxydecanoyl-(acyl carrier protein) dehydratase